MPLDNCVGANGYTCIGDFADHGEIRLSLQVLSDAKGWYLGYHCPKCGPVSRETGYFPDEATAALALEQPFPHLRKPGFNKTQMSGDPDYTLPPEFD